MPFHLLFLFVQNSRKKGPSYFILMPLSDRDPRSNSQQIPWITISTIHTKRKTCRCHFQLNPNRNIWFLSQIITLAIVDNHRWPWFEAHKHEAYFALHSYKQLIKPCVEVKRSSLLIDKHIKNTELKGTSINIEPFISLFNGKKHLIRKQVICSIQAVSYLRHIHCLLCLHSHRRATLHGIENGNIKHKYQLRSYCKKKKILNH